MAFEYFENKMRDLAARSGITVRVFQSDGKHRAEFSDGTVIIGNSTSKKLCVKWGSGHTAMVAV